MATEATTYQYKLIPDLMSGIRKDMRADSIPDSSAMALNNVTLRDGLVAVDKGYKKFMEAVDGTPQLILQHDYPGGTSDLVLVTQTDVYERVSGEWNYAIGVHPSGSTKNSLIGHTTAADNAAIGATTITVASSASFVTGCKVGIQYKPSSPALISGATAGSTTEYVITGVQAYIVGNRVLLGGFATAGYNVVQAITAITIGDTTTTIVTDLDSNSLGSTAAASGEDRIVDRNDQTLEHRTTATFTGSSTTWTLAAGLPGRMLSGARIVRPYAMSGGPDVIPDHVFISSWKPEQNPGNGSPTDATSEGASIVSNFNDIPIVLCKGSGGVIVRELDLSKIRTGAVASNAFTSSVAALGNIQVKTVELFQEKLCLGNCVEDGVGHASRLRMSRTADYENFESDNGGEVFDLLEGGSPIRAVRTMGKILGVYKGKSIIRGDYTGAVDASTRFHTIVDNEGAISTHAVAKVPGYHYIAGTRDIYKWNGGASLERIGGPIREDLYTPNRFANLNMKEFIHTVYDPEYQELEVFYPEGIIKGTRKSFRYSEQNKAWTARSYTHYFTYSTDITSVTRLTWNQLLQNWTTYQQPWNGAFFVNEKEHRFHLLQGTFVDQDGDVLSESTNYVVDGNQVAKDELSYPIFWQFDSKDFYLPNSLIRVDYIDAYVSGDDVSLWYSHDFNAEIGREWDRVKVFNAQDELQAERVFLNRAARRIRFRLKGSSTNFQLGWVGFSFAPEFSW